MKDLGAFLAAAASLACVFASAPVIAEPVPRSLTVNAAGACNGALPSFEGALRKRPTAISNEGAANAFVSCSLAGDASNTGNVDLQVGFTNKSAAPVSFACTFVDGYAQGFFGLEPLYYPTTVAVAANAIGAAQWTAEEGTAFSNNANVSCVLPPGVEINLLLVQFDEDNGV